MKKYFAKFLFGALFLSVFITPLALNATSKVETPDFGIGLQSSKINDTVNELESLLMLMQERLVLMQEIAKHKWNKNLKDKVLEQELIAQNSPENLQIGAFLIAQDKAAKKVQENAFKQFNNAKSNHIENAKDFESELRPLLNDLNSKIKISISKLNQHLQDECLPDFIKDLSFGPFENEGVQKDVYEIAVSPLFLD